MSAGRGWEAVTADVDRHELRPIIAGLSEGEILVQPDWASAWCANAAAPAMQGAESLNELGPTMDAYRDRFCLRDRSDRGAIENLANLRRREVGRAKISAVNLTVRERQILNLVCAGRNNAANARTLNLSRNHDAAIHRKIGVRKGSGAVVWGRGNGFSMQVSGAK
ncbi:hypothetical protein MCBMB27_01693 [Methylobacterium phyllosphaerae]|uniref:HTH luxR-type domain-containing protein n=1 Tax=Methylobacterium phyllosphaerae TaxID=418223 RepID=A0AAE8L4W5_9HYPH|nr:hypothetical protein MCBMB27_01693 [Methylobacterium phyllosphaerae]SFG33054.1 hypothetical protein SAMN05192567_102135 [Methylobacterium phyllosphaerae]